MTTRGRVVRAGHISSGVMHMAKPANAREAVQDRWDRSHPDEPDTGGQS